MAKMKPNVSYDPATSLLTIELDLSGMAGEILTAYGLKPIKTAGGKPGRPKKVGKRGRPKKTATAKTPGKRGRPKKSATKAPTAKKAGKKRVRRSSADVQAEKTQKALGQKARKALKLPLRGRLNPEDKTKLEKKIAELSK
jgi:hypothetical protein